MIRANAPATIWYGRRVRRRRHHVVLGVAVHHVGAVAARRGHGRDRWPRRCADPPPATSSSSSPPNIESAPALPSCSRRCCAEHDVAVPRWFSSTAAADTADPRRRSPRRRRCRIRRRAQSYDVEVGSRPSRVVVDPVERVGLLGRLRAVALTEHQIAYPLPARKSPPLSAASVELTSNSRTSRSVPSNSPVSGACASSPRLTRALSPAMMSPPAPPWIVSRSSNSPLPTRPGTYRPSMAEPPPVRSSSSSSPKMTSEPWLPST